jgi:alpha-galactosidase
MPEVVVLEGEKGPMLDNGLLLVKVHLNKGTFDVIDVGRGVRVIRDAATSVALKDGPTFTTRGEGVDFVGADDVEDAHGRGIAFLLTRGTYEDEPELHVTIGLYDDQPFVLTRIEVQNGGPAAIRVHALRPIDSATLDLGTSSGLRFYKQGWQSWSPTVVLDCDGEDVAMTPPVVGPGTQPPTKPGRFVSDLMTAIVRPDPEYGVVAGFISSADHFSHVYFDRDDASLSAVSYGDGIEVPPGRMLASEKLYLEPTQTPARSMCWFGDAMAREMEAAADSRVASGWCSWYYYWQGVSETEVVANLDFISANRESLPVDCIQIDDGYQSEIGDWLTVNDKFPNGMKSLADRIHEAGFKAGIWVAPFLAGARSKLFQEHPEWFVRFSTGAPAIATMNWGQLCFALDTTHPEVIDWLQNVFRTICNKWGYDYVKIDFIFAAAVDGVRHDAEATRAGAYRSGLETIRETVGDRFILACGNPQGASAGLVDGARVGPDVAPYWVPFHRAAPRDPMSDPSALNSIRNSILRFWMHRRLWINDPDCLLVRDTDTALTEDEVRTLTTVIGMTGGMVLDSDNLPKVPPDRLRMISTLLPVYGKSALPIDLFQTQDVPSILELDCRTHRLLSLFNWGEAEETRRAALPEGSWHAFEFWSREYLGSLTGSIAVPLPAHGCAHVRLTRNTGRPAVVGSTLHVTQGAMEVGSERWDGSRLRVRLTPVANKDGELIVWRADRVETVAIIDLREERALEL